MSPARKKDEAGRGSASGTSAPGTATRSRPDWVEDWKRLTGAPPPPRLSTRLLRLGVAYHEQAGTHGGLKSRTRKRLYEIAASARSGAEPTVPQTARDKAITGTRLVREWHGRTHVVDINDHGIVYEGRTYRSLSEVARAITGARWSGPRFFGL